MSTQRKSGLRSPAALAFTTAAVTAFSLVGTGSALADPGIPGSESYESGVYVVQVAGEPAASYDGGVSGYEATKPKAGEQFDKDSAAVKRYQDYLAEAQQSVLSKVPGADEIYSYDTSFNGFAVDLTAAEATRMAKTNGVVNMWKNETHEADTTDTPTFLGLTGEDGVWEQQYGGDEHAGEGVIVGVIDSGFWPENPSFAALPGGDDRRDQDIIDAKWNGTCDEGADTAENNVICNNKVIGARYFDEGINASGTPPIEGEFTSPRDYGGHGSHTASTAAGNYGVDASIDGHEVGKISGMAPAARLAVYKVCWETGVNACATDIDIIAAIDAAINDGVDVINYSISGSTTYAVDPVHMAFFNAAASGVFIAASAGNSGPTESTVAHNTPWITTVAASTHDRAFKSSATLGDGTVLTGAGRGAALPETAVVLSKDIAAAGVDPSDANLCVPGSLDPAKAAGKIVACQRGQIARVDKSLAVLQAGGVGMIHYNVAGGASDIAADFHSVPTVHITADKGETLLAYLASTDTPTASLSAGEKYKKEAPEMASFSSAGPAIAGDGDLLKPDITAPGVDVIAAVAPPGNNGNNFASYQGTSMSSPHIAGLAALVIGKHPDWSPAAVRSALMTTATTLDNQGNPIQRGGEDATPFDYGAGHVRVAEAMDPGLVYDSGAEDWLAYLCGIHQLELLPNGSAYCDTYGGIDPSDLNYPSIAIGQLAGKQTITRTVTNVGDRVETYFADIDAPEGTKVSVKRHVITLRPGKSLTFKMTITRTDAPLDEYTFGSLTWKSFRGHEVRSPIVVRPVAMSVPGEVSGEGADGSLSYDVTPGFSGTLNAVPTALAPGQTTTLPLKNPDGSSFDTSNPATNDHVAAYEFTVPSDAMLGRVSTKDEDYAQYGEGTDVDLFVYLKNGDGSLTYLGASASSGSTESATLPAGMTFVVYVDLYAAPAGMNALDVQLHSWKVGAEGAALSVEPASQDVSVGDAVDVTASWSGLEPGDYLGVIAYLDGDGNQVGYTIVNVTA